jgi:hypothetical protein
MHQFVARENIDHYLRLLNSTGLGPEKRATVTKLLIEELHKLSHDLELLGFAEQRAANGRDRLNHLRGRLDFTPKPHRAEAERVVANVEATQHLLEDFCHQLRNRVSNHH